MTQPGISTREEDRRDAVLPIHIAVHYIGCAVRTGRGVRVPSRAGLYLDVLAERVRHVTVVAYEPPGDPDFEDTVEYEVKARNISLLSLGPKGTWRDRRERRRRIAGIISEASTSWDVLLFYFLPNRRASLVNGPNRCPRVVGFVVGTVDPGDLPASTTVLRRSVVSLNRHWTALQQRAVIRRAGLVLVNSDELRASVPPGTNVRTVVLAARRREHSFRTDDRFRGEHINMFFAGRITLEKGVLDAVEAFAIMRRRSSNVRFHVAGEGPALPQMLERADELGIREDLVMHGWLPTGDALFSVLKGMDVFLLPSYAAYEGFPQVIWEAMAHSVPVVSTAVRGPRESLSHEHELLFVPMHDPTAIADAVFRLENEPGLRQGIIARAFEVASSVSIEETVGATLEGIAETWPALRSR